MMQYPEYSTDFITQQMSLRKPQEDSLTILDQIMHITNISKDTDTEALLTDVNAQYPTCKDFERDFPSMTFALATGVGKTKLMGAFVTYLYTNFGIRNFFVLAPNLTIYNKLISDFAAPDNPKYVFAGIDCFVQKRPRVITGETYHEELPGQMSLEESVNINIFNIGKINAEMRKGMQPRIKRLSEYLGQSYFDYLAGCSDLVMLMDESHHYRADRGMEVINQLRPLLGLELTATPQVEKGTKTIKFKNVVYEYSLAKAIVDGYVKEPAAATRKDFNPNNYNTVELDRLKLRDAIRLHRATKAELEVYAINENVKRVLPFVLVVCRDTDHAAEVKEYIASRDFFDGYYYMKTIEVHSNQRGDEKDDNISRLVGLEDENNTVEIVIHVNMLKEGWDVTNLYTIVPLRAASSQTLIEQTIGRGLRLPFEKRTGNEIIDRVTVVAHERFDKLIEEAHSESSIIRAENIITLDDDEDSEKDKESGKSQTHYQQRLDEIERLVEVAETEEQKRQAERDLIITNATSKAIAEVMAQTQTVSTRATPSPTSAKVPLAVLPVGQPSTPNSQPHQPVTPKPIAPERIADLASKAVKSEIRKRTKKHLEGQLTIEELETVDEKIDNELSVLVEQKIRSTIDIPDIALVPKVERTYGFHDFDLQHLYVFSSYRVPSEVLRIENLKDGQFSFFNEETGQSVTESLEDMILMELLDVGDEIAYNDQYNSLWMKLIRQALAELQKHMKGDEVAKTVIHYKKDIARDIYSQIMQPEHFYLNEPDFEVRIIKPISDILPCGYTKYRQDEILHYATAVQPYELRSKIFGGYSRACHTEYKFDSRPEQVLSIVLDQDQDILKWLRPAPKQFKMYYHGSRLYEPDFIVEAEHNILMVEVKSRRDMESEDVIMKAKAGETFCAHVSTFTDKPWAYVLIDEAAITRSSSFAELVRGAARNVISSE